PLATNVISGSHALRYAADQFCSPHSNSPQHFEYLIQLRRFLDTIALAKQNRPVLIHDENSPPTSACRLAFPLQHSIFFCHFSVRPEIAADWKIKGPNLALPCGSIHNGFYADRDCLGTQCLDLFSLRLILAELPCTHLLPIERIERQHHVLLPTLLAQTKSSFYSGK